MLSFGQIFLPAPALVTYYSQDAAQQAMAGVPATAGWQQLLLSAFMQNHLSASLFAGTALHAVALANGWPNSPITK